MFRLHTQAHSNSVHGLCVVVAGTVTATAAGGVSGLRCRVQAGGQSVYARCSAQTRAAFWWQGRRRGCFCNFSGVSPTECYRLLSSS